MKVWIDGDACPDIKKLVSLCHKYRVPVAIVCDDSHEFPLDEVKMVSTCRDVFIKSHARS